LFFKRFAGNSTGMTDSPVVPLGEQNPREEPKNYENDEKQIDKEALDQRIKSD